MTQKFAFFKKKEYIAFQTPSFRFVLEGTAKKTEMTAEKN
jgi:hypothetical protein